MKNLAIFTLAILINAITAAFIGYVVELSLIVLAVAYIPYDSGNLSCAFEASRVLSAIVTAAILIYSHNPILNFLNNHLGDRK